MRTQQGRLAPLAVALIIGCSVGKLFDAPPAKVINVTPSRVVDSAAQGSSDTKSAALVISTLQRDATPSWTAHTATGEPWLTLATVTGSAPDTLALTLDPDSLPSGIYRDTVVIVPDDGDVASLRVPVELRILPPPPPATNLVFTGNPPSNIVLNGAFSVEVTARDDQGATATGFSGLVSLTLQGPVVGGGLSGQTSINAVNGVASFTNLHVTGLCTGCTLTAAASGLAGATSTSFNVIAGP